MRKYVIGAALAAAAFFVMPAAYAQHAIDPAQIHAPTNFAAENALAAPGASFETARLMSDPVVNGEVAVPYGDWLAAMLASGQALLLAAALWLLRKLPGQAVNALQMFAGLLGQGRVDQLLEKAIGYGVNATEDAVRGKTLTVKVGNEVLERAFEYAVRHAPGLVDQLGGFSALREKIIARLDMEAAAAVPTPRPAADSLVSTVVPAPAAAAAAAPAAT